LEIDNALKIDQESRVFHTSKDLLFHLLYEMTFILKKLKLVRQNAGHLKVRLKQKPKVFVIGANKTGTTSMNKFLQDLGYRMGPQRKFELLAFDYFDGKWERILNIIKNYEAFQDTPFSKATNEFLLELQQRYPDAKFILSTRDDASEWYHSLLQFHRKLWFKDKAIVDWKDVKEVNYGTEGLLLHFMLSNHSLETLPDGYSKLPYDQEILEQWYNDYNSRIVKFFEGNANFIVVNLKDQNTTDQLKEFLGHPTSRARIGRLNVTAERQ